MRRTVLFFCYKTSSSKNFAGCDCDVQPGAWVFRPSATKSERPYRVTSMSSWGTPSQAPREGQPRGGGLALRCHVMVGGALLLSQCSSERTAALLQSGAAFAHETIPLLNIQFPHFIFLRITRGLVCGCDIHFGLIWFTTPNPRMARTRNPFRHNRHCCAMQGFRKVTCRGRRAHFVLTLWPRYEGNTFVWAANTFARTMDE